MPTLNEETIQKKEMGKLGKLNIVIGAINNTQKAFKNIQHGLMHPFTNSV